LSKLRLFVVLTSSYICKKHLFFVSFFIDLLMCPPSCHATAESQTKESETAAAAKTKSFETAAATEAVAEAKAEADSKASKEASLR
jgi:hypothetical protein